MSHSGYLTSIFNPKAHKKMVPKVIEKIKKLQRKIKFEAIAFSGFSGAGIVFPTFYETQIPIICVRKEKTMHGYTVEATKYPIKNYIIIDDFIRSGETIDRIINNLSSYDDFGKCKGILLYSSDRENPYNKIKVYTLD